MNKPEQQSIRIDIYDERWPDRYRAHAKTIAKALGPSALQIEHIGSTSVPDLAAKPIVDILVVLENSADEAAYLPQLTAAGYELRVREPEFHEHRMFRTRAQDTHIHVLSKSSSEIARYLVFRDRLRSSPADRREYEQVKRELARQSWNNMDAYADAKSEVVENIIRRAYSDSA